MVAVFNALGLLLASSYVLGQQLPLYAAHSQLRLSRQQGSRLNLVFWIFNFVSKTTAVVVATHVGAGRMVYAFLALYSGASVFVLWRGAELTHPELEACVALLGVGAGPLYAIALLIFEDILPVTPRIAGLIYVGNVVGVKCYPLVIGFLVEEHPAAMFVGGILTGLTALIYVALGIFKQRIKAKLEVEDL